MSFTDQCDIFASFHEEGFNRILGHVRRQRPSLFNYATQGIARDLELLCRRIDAHEIVWARGNPPVTIVDPLPIPGTEFGVPFAIQIAELALDFHPGGVFALPAELAPLGAQRLALKLKICGGIGCPSRDVVIKLTPRPSDQRPESPKATHEDPDPRSTRTITPLPTQKLHCFCLDAFVSAGVRIATYSGKPYLEPFLQGFEIVEVKPEGLESSLECYIGLLLQLSLLPGLRVLLRHAPLNLTQGATDLFPQPTNIALTPTPTSAALPNNPAIEMDLLKAFINVEVS